VGADCLFLEAFHGFYEKSPCIAGGMMHGLLEAFSTTKVL